MASSFVPQPVAGAAPSSVLGKAVLPSARIASFQNQQIGSLNAGLGAGTSQLSPTQVALGQKASQSPVQISAQKQQGQVKTGGERLTKLAQQAAQKRLGGVTGTAKGMAGAGQAWKPDGTLSASRNKALSLASSYLGTPYVYGGTTQKGIDCSGLVMMVYNQLGYNLNHSSAAQGRNIPGVRTNLSNLRPGDIVAWKDGTHIAIYAGNGQIMEAARPGTSVRRVNLWANPNAVYGIALRLPGE